MSRKHGPFSYVGLGLGQRTGVVGNDQAVLDAQRHARERLAAGRSGDALAGLRHVVGAVRRALHVLAVLGEELVLDPVEPHRYVPATIDVGMERAAEIGSAS